MNDQRIAIVTAGGSGMEAAAAWKLHEQGYAVSISSLSGTAEALAKRLGGIGVSSSYRC